MTQPPFPRFFRAVVLSCTSPNFYKQVITARLWTSWKYFFCIQFFTTLITIISFVVAVWTFDLHGLLEKIHTGVVDAYPPELVVTINKEGYSINQDRPYTVPMPESLKVRNPQEEYIENIIVFESDNTLKNIDQFWDYKAAMVATETKIYAHNNKNGYKNISVTPIEPSYFSKFTTDIVINKSMIDSIPIEKVSEYVLLHKSFYTPIIAILLFVIAYPFSLFTGIIKLFFLTLFVFIGFTIFASKKRLSFDRMFQVSIHSSTLFLLIRLLLSVVGIPVNSMLSFAGFLIWTSYILSSISQNKVTPSVLNTSVT